MIKVIDAKFLTSAVGTKDSVSEGVAEVSFLGRSNVGKSSLLNALANHKNLAKKSSTPGKTRLINFFEITYNTEDKKKVHFVDLPGFGYAKVSKSEQNIWQRNLTSFLKKRLSIRLFLLLIDSRHRNLSNDKEVEEFLYSIKRGDQNIIKVFTKIDKLNQKEISKLKRENPNALMVSSLNKKGIDKLNEIIFSNLLGEYANIQV